MIFHALSFSEGLCHIIELYVASYTSIVVIAPIDFTISYFLMYHISSREISGYGSVCATIANHIKSYIGPPSLTLI